MDIRIYDPPEEECPRFAAVARLTAAVSVTAVERHYTPGYFEITVPTEARHAEKLTEGRLVWIDGGMWGIVDSVHCAQSEGGDLLTASGRQLKGLTADRITIPPDVNPIAGAQGYDTVTGSTEACMKHYAAANLGPGASASRRVCGLTIAADLGRGVAEDKYMSRHDRLDIVLQDLGEASQLGYDIIPDLQTHRLLFDMVAGEDHTAGQSRRKRVIFDIRRRTALAMSYDYDAGDSRNVFYTTMAGAEFADEALTVTYLREGEEEQRGIRRREQHLSVSADTPIAGEEYSELRRKALIEAERYKAAESLTCEIAEGPYRYREDYRLGDLVTLQCQGWGVSMDARLTEMQTEYSTGGIRHTAVFGTAPLTVFGRLQRQLRRGG